MQKRIRVVWGVLQSSAGEMKRALILSRGARPAVVGRAVTTAGVEVDTLAVYTRQPARFQPRRCGGCGVAGRATKLALVVASSEAATPLLASLIPSLGRRGRARRWRLLARGAIAQRLRKAGFTDVKLVMPEVEAIRKAALVR